MGGLRKYMPITYLTVFIGAWANSGLPPFAGFFLYYPSRRQQPAALSALIDTLRMEDGRT